VKEDGFIGVGGLQGHDWGDASLLLLRLYLYDIRHLPEAD
jgi:hypothetical protein